MVRPQKAKNAALSRSEEYEPSIAGTKHFVERSYFPATNIPWSITQVQRSGNGRPQRGMGHARGNSRCWTYGFCKHVRGSVVPKENKKKTTESVCNQNTQRQCGQRSANDQKHQHATISFFLIPCDGHLAIANSQKRTQNPCENNHPHGKYSL